MKVFVTAKGALYLEHGCITRTTSHRSTVRLFRNNPMMVEQQLDCGFLLGLSKTSVCSVLFNFEGSLLIKEQGIVDMQPSEKYAFRIHVTYGNEKTRRKRTYYLSPRFPLRTSLQFILSWTGWPVLIVAQDHFRLITIVGWVQFSMIAIPIWSCGYENHSYHF